MQYGKWTLIETAGRKSKCQCLCGTIRHVLTNDLKRGVSKSCGCSSKERIGKPNIHTKKHGMTGTPTFTSWVEMRRRCRNNNKNRPDYKNYAGRGISFCNEWDSFSSFLNDMGKRPEGTTLERVDNNKGYSKDNCIWANRKIQERNKRTNRVFSIDGKLMTVAEISEKYGINYYTLYGRISRGWDVLKAITPAKIASPLRSWP